ncbi:MAG: hypothetical protein Q8R83_06105 [Legionellaceae bacterium]|nr:hypothetical protein [Legionellaceae bacterium]
MKKQEINSILDEPIDLGTVEVPCRGWKRLLEVLGILKPRTERLILKGATASTMLRITSMIEDLVVESKRKGGDLQMYHLINANIVTICEIIAVAIHNRPGPPPQWMSDAILNQMPQARIRIIMKDVYGRLGVEDFFDTLGLIRNLNNPENDTPEIAPNTPALEE